MIHHLLQGLMLPLFVLKNMQHIHNELSYYHHIFSY